MPLLPPRVIGPISVCNEKVRVEGQLTGAEITVFADGALVGKEIATGPKFNVPLDKPLSSGQVVTATQTIGQETSIQSPDGITVQSKPPDIPPVSFITPLHECGLCVWLEGAVPGAKVEVHSHIGFRGKGESFFGDARLRLNAPIGSNEILESVQEACGETGPQISGPQPVPMDIAAENKKLPTPVVVGPLAACEKAVTVSGIIPGATVTLHRSHGPDMTACFDRSELFFIVNPPLVENELVSAEQEFLECEAYSDLSAVVLVGPAGPVMPPKVKGPLCMGDTSIVLTNIKYGALVRIYYGTTELGMAEAPENGEFEFAIPPLSMPSHHGNAVNATQELCNITSVPSAPVPVHHLPDDLPQPRITPPLFECLTGVHVANIHPGARVVVISSLLDAPIGEMKVFAEEATIPVAPLLIAGDSIIVFQKGCGQESEGSEPVEVLSLPDQIEEPEVFPAVYDCHTSVTVGKVLPGARVDILVDGIFRGTALGGAFEVEVPVTGKLIPGQIVTARQRICHLVTDPGESQTVLHFDGLWFRVGDEKVAGILAVHAALLHTGQILYFGGDQHDGALSKTGNVDHSRLFDCRTHAITTVTGLVTDTKKVNLFCAGQAQLPDGRILAAGGTHQWPGDVDPDPHKHGKHGDEGFNHFTGSREAYIFDPDDNQWHETDKLLTQRPDDPRLDLKGGNIADTGGKWYPTLVMLPNEHIIAVSGHPREFDSRHNNDTLETFDPLSEKWSYVGDKDCSLVPSVVGRSHEYPRLFVLPDNRLLNVNRMNDGNVSAWNIGNDANDWEYISPAKEGYDGDPKLYTAVILPLRYQDEYKAQILLCGNQNAYVLDPDSATWTTTIRQLAGNPRRINLDVVILPTGEILIEGGVQVYDADTTGVKQAEMFDPEDKSDSSAGSWRVLPAAEQVRNYHSVALLMPDGAVWVAGSNFNSATGADNPDNRNLTIEIYQPWYFCHRRPQIEWAQNIACIGDKFMVKSPDAPEIERVVIVRCGSVTHNFNSDQRLIELEFSLEAPDYLHVETPPNSAIAPSGYYLLFLLDENRVPSEGRFIRICPSLDGSFPPVEPSWESYVQADLEYRLEGLDPQLVENLIKQLRKQEDRSRKIRKPAVDP